MERYRILKKLAEGGSGKTYLVWDKHLEKEWVMKCIGFQNADGADVQHLETAKQEIKVLRQLQIKGVPMLADAFYEAGSICLILEYRRGISLEEKIKRDGVMKEDEVVFYALSLAEILRQMHEGRRPLIHGDIKPLNLIWNEEGLSLLDFGTAVFAYGDAACRQGRYYTPGYAPPELWQGDALCEASDIYAFGAVIAYMLDGIPAEKRRGNFALRAKRADIRPALERIVLNCTKQEKSERYPSLAEAERALKKLEQLKKRSLFQNMPCIWKRREQKFQIIESILLTDGKG